MKANLKKISVLLAALTVASAMTTAVSAGGIAIFKDDRGNSAKGICAVCGSVIDKCEDTEKAEKTPAEKKVFATSKTNGNVSEFIWNDGSTKIVSSAEANRKPEINKKPDFKKPVNQYHGYDIIGGKYYTTENVKKELAKYFDENSYDLYFQKGNERTFCNGAYYYSTDTDVVYYNYKTGKLVANSVGSAEVYVYTTGGIPFFRIDVTVDNKIYAKNKPVLEVIPEDWNLSVGDKTTFKVTASDGKTYDDIVLTIKEGADNAKLGAQSGILTAEANGPVVVQAYSKSNSDIYGDALIYIGNYTGAVTDGGWKIFDGGIKVDSWKYDIFDYERPCHVNGWIKDAEGIFVPVIKFEDATVYDKNGSYETTIVTGGSVSIADLLKDAYGDKDAVAAIIKKYNLSKYGIKTEKDCYNYIDYLDYIVKKNDYKIYADIDMKDIILGQLIKDLIG